MELEKRLDKINRDVRHMTQLVKGLIELCKMNNQALNRTAAIIHREHDARIRRKKNPSTR